MNPPYSCVTFPKRVIDCFGDCTDPVWQHKYFVIKGVNGYPSQIHMALFKDGKKMNGHNLIPDELTDKTFCFNTLKEMEAYKCPCGKPGCVYGLFLLKCIINFRNQIHRT